MTTITAHAVCIGKWLHIGPLGYGRSCTLVSLLYCELHHAKGKTGSALLFVRYVESLLRFARRLYDLRVRPPNGQYPYSILVGFHGDAVKNQKKCENYKSKPSCVQKKNTTRNTRDYWGRRRHFVFSLPSSESKETLL